MAIQIYCIYVYYENRNEQVLPASDMFRLFTLIVFLFAFLVCNIRTNDRLVLSRQFFPLSLALCVDFANNSIIVNGAICRGICSFPTILYYETSTRTKLKV
jgi:hypothetical protein